MVQGMDVSVFRQTSLGPLNLTYGGIRVWRALLLVLISPPKNGVDKAYSVGYFQWFIKGNTAPLASSAMLVSLQMAAANAAATVTSVRLQSCAANTQSAWVGSRIKVLIRWFVTKNLFSLLGGDFSFALVSPLHCFRNSSFPWLGLELWPAPCAGGDCWEQSHAQTTQTASPLPAPRPFFIQLAFLILFSLQPAEDRVGSMGHNCIKEAFISHLEGHLLAGRLVRTWYWSWEKAVSSGGFSGLILPYLPYQQCVHLGPGCGLDFRMWTFFSLHGA